ncbi:MAG: phosphoserine phosphatase SerB [Rhodospirillaceae bacterium]|nr:phosphoserine phosphatase SerB [Rhodospirillaceae bacterium]
MTPDRDGPAARPAPGANPAAEASPGAGVLTLIAPPEAPLAAETVALARDGVAAAGGRAAEVAWLGPTACDIPFEGAEPSAVEAAVRAGLAGRPVDLAAQPARGRRKRLLVADMESTIVTRELLDELAGLAGLRDEVAAVTARSMRGEVDFAESLRRRAAMLAGLDASLIDRVRALIELTPGARTLVATMRAHGAYTMLVSGGFDCFTAVAARACGFDEHRGNRLVVENGRLAGSVGDPILGAAGKLAALEEAAAARGLSPADAAAVGDGANDIPMLRAAGLGVAFRGKPAVTAAARHRLDYADLTGLLYMQGYRAADFVS